MILPRFGLASWRLSGGYFSGEFLKGRARASTVVPVLIYICFVFSLNAAYAQTDWFARAMSARDAKIMRRQ